jgi:glycogen operon protein
VAEPLVNDDGRPPAPGDPFPLGATVVAGGVNLAVWAPSAELVEACIFDDDEQETRVPLSATHEGIHHGLLEGARAGLRYGLRAHGPWNPQQGQRFNPAKLVMDPYARAIDGEVVSSDALRVYARDDPGTADPRDTAALVPRSVVVAPDHSRSRPLRPGTPWSSTVIYELHVKGFTARMSQVPERLRGTYAGLGHPAAVQHLLDLGVSAVQLMPVHHFVSEPALVAHGLSNYWGYNTLGFFAPHAAYSSSGSRGQQVVEFAAMVDGLHDAGIEVLLDVVYNHTCEAGLDGPTLSFRGLGEADHYKLVEGGRTYFDTTGCGNNVDVGDLGVLRLVMDSLRYWVLEMGVDGFRFDLASALTREELDCEDRASFLAAVHQDPVLRTVKVIAEPWDVGSGGYRLGSFGAPWSEWNDKYRGAVRGFWNREPGARSDPGEMGWRLTGSEDIFYTRSPRASINFITAHDGFTLADLVSYDRKHNEANGEFNHDGSDDNRSWNHGVEGPTDDAAVLADRARTSRALLATLLLSTGTPMLLMGDEIGHTQGGNNNAYCQDNETTWLDWQLDDRRSALLMWTRALVALRRAHPTLRQDRFFDGRRPGADQPPDLAWLQADGTAMSDRTWHDPTTTLLLAALSGNLAETDRAGRPQHDDSFLIAWNGGDEDATVTLPAPAGAHSYARVLDTADETPATDPPVHPCGQATTVSARSVAVFRQQ